MNNLGFEEGSSFYSIFNADKLSKFNFILLMFFTFFGTSMPFQNRTGVDEFVEYSGNPVNQVLYTFLFISALVVVITNFRKVELFIRKEKFLTLFLFLCFSSALWSEYSLISFKGSFSIFVTFIVIMNTFLFIEYDVILKYLRIIIFLYLIVTLVTVAIVPAAKDPGFNSWRGIAAQKNGLAAIGVVFFLLSFLILQSDSGYWVRIRMYIVICLYVLIVVMTASSTALISIVIILSLLGVFKIDKIFVPLRIGRFVSTTIILFELIFIITLLYFADELLSLVPQLFDKDLTFSGRTLIWEFVLEKSSNHPLLGCGFVSFWVMGSAQVAILIDLYNMPLNEAHNGYLDIYNQLGIIGISLFLVLIGAFLIRAIKSKDKILPVILISILVINFTESSLFRPRTPETFLFIFSYLLTAYRANIDYLKD